MTFCKCVDRGGVYTALEICADFCLHLVVTSKCVHEFFWAFVAVEIWNCSSLLHLLQRVIAMVLENVASGQNYTKSCWYYGRLGCLTSR